VNAHGGARRGPAGAPRGWSRVTQGRYDVGAMGRRLALVDQHGRALADEELSPAAPGALARGPTVAAIEAAGVTARVPRDELLDEGARAPRCAARAIAARFGADQL